LGERVLRLFALLIVLASTAGAVTLSELGEGLGNVDHSRMAMKFEVTFMKIDVANVAVSLPSETADTIGSVVIAGKHSDDSRDEIRRHLLDVDDALITMTFLRDAGLDKFLKGIRKNLEAALKSELIDEIEYDALWAAAAEHFAFLDERGILKNDVVAYRVDGNSVRTIYQSVDGDVLMDVTMSEEFRGRGLKSAYFGPKSRFGDKLIKSLYESENS
jgi:hypothetical protein